VKVNVILILINTQEEIKNIQLFIVIVAKRKRTTKNSIQDDGEIGGPQQTTATFFSQPDQRGYSQTKIEIRITLLIMYC